MKVGSHSQGYWDGTKWVPDVSQARDYAENAQIKRAFKDYPTKTDLFILKDGVSIPYMELFPESLFGAKAETKVPPSGKTTTPVPGGQLSGSSEGSQKASEAKATEAKASETKS